MLKLFVMLAFFALSSVAASPVENPERETRIQVALLLDTSGSMDGLIAQAKAQLWKMVNELATAKKNGKAPRIEIALYEYGKSSYKAEDGYIQQITPLTTDLDLVSEKLFELGTNGGDEYCGWAIQDAHQELEWSKSNKDLKLIIIAGNEAFTQGTVDYKVSCKAAITDGIVVNTIFCGNCEEGVRLNWKDGADRADGKYMCINQNEQVAYIETPFDKRINELNQELNDTYIGYGRMGQMKKERQIKQDVNAASLGAANMANRAQAKSSSAYRNDDWDLVDASAERGEAAIEEVEEAELPEEMRDMDMEERKSYVAEKSEKRNKIQAEIKEIQAKREAFIAEERQKQAGEKSNTLDAVMIKTMREQAKARNFKFED